MDLAEYCREVEDHLCRRNQGHLVRIVGPAFERVVAWAERGVPLKLVLRAIDRRCERYYAKGPRRRPVRIEYCEADVLDLFDEWRRAVGVSLPVPSQRAEPARRRGGLRGHIDRAVLRLTALAANPTTSAGLAGSVGRALDALEKLRDEAGRARGEARERLVDALARLDRELIESARASADAALVASARQEAQEQVRPFYGRMDPAALNEARDRAADRLLVERLGLPQIRW